MDVIRDEQQPHVLDSAEREDVHTCTRAVPAPAQLTHLERLHTSAFRIERYAHDVAVEIDTDARMIRSSTSELVVGVANGAGREGVATRSQSECAGAFTEQRICGTQNALRRRPEARQSQRAA